MPGPGPIPSTGNCVPTWPGGRSPATWPPRRPCSPWRSGSPVMAQGEASLTSRARCGALGCRRLSPSGLHAVGTAQEGVSNPGSRMGAAGRCEAGLEAVTLPDRMPLTCGNVVQQRVCRGARSVRIEGVNVLEQGEACCSRCLWRQATGRYPYGPGAAEDLVDIGIAVD